MSIRVHRRTRDLRTDLDKGAAGNTCRIVKAHLFKGVRKAASSYVPALHMSGNYKKTAAAFAATVFFLVIAIF